MITPCVRPRARHLKASACERNIVCGDHCHPSWTATVVFSTCPSPPFPLRLRILACHPAPPYHMSSHSRPKSNPPHPLNQPSLPLRIAKSLGRFGFQFLDDGEESLETCIQEGKRRTKLVKVCSSSGVARSADGGCESGPGQQEKEDRWINSIQVGASEGEVRSGARAQNAPKKATSAKWFQEWPNLEYA